MAIIVPTQSMYYKINQSRNGFLKSNILLLKPIYHFRNTWRYDKTRKITFRKRNDPTRFSEGNNAKAQYQIGR